MDNRDAGDGYDLENAFRRYQNIREAQARRVVDTAHLMARIDTLDNLLFKFMQRHLLSHIGMELTINTLGQIIAPAVRLKHLPLVPRHRLVSFGDETKIKPRDRSILANALWILLLASIVLIHYLMIWQADSNFVEEATLQSVSKFWGRMEASKRAQLHHHMSVAVVTPIFCLESYRQFFFLTLLGRYVRKRCLVV